jgi:hypothetical protein
MIMIEGIRSGVCGWASLSDGLFQFGARHLLGGVLILAVTILLVILSRNGKG